MSSQPLIGWQPLSDVGAVMAGAKAYFYRTGTSTPKNTYSNKGLTSANANPVVADANGRFGAIFLLKDEGYRCVLKTSADVTIYTKDEVFADAFAADVEARVLQIAACPLDYGAAGDGVTDDYAAIQAAITASTGAVDLVGKTYKCNSALSLKAGLTLKNGTLDFSSADAEAYIVAQGSRGSAVNLSSNASIHGTSISVSSGSGLSAGDWLFVYSTTAWDGSYNVGEIVRINTISGTLITTDRPLHASYNTAASAAIKKLSFVDNVRMENVVILGSTSASATNAAIKADITSNFILESVIIRNVKGAMIDVRASAGTRIRNCELNNCAAIAMDIGEHSVDTNIANCQIGKVSGSHGIRIGYGQTAGGITLDTVIESTKLYRAVAASSSAVLIEEASFNSTIDRCSIAGRGAASTGVEVQGVNVIVSNTEIRSMASEGVYISSLPTNTDSQPWKVDIRGCRIDNSAAPIKNTTLSSNIIVAIDDCHISGSDTAPINGIGLFSLTGPVITNCYIEDCSSRPIYLDSCTDVVVSKNTLVGSNYGVVMLSCTRVHGLIDNAYVSQTIGNHSGDTGPVGLVHVREVVTRASMTDGGGTSGTKDIGTTIPQGARFINSLLSHLSLGFTGDTSATIQIGDGTDVDRYNTGTPSVFTAATPRGVDLGVPSGTAWHTAAATPKVTITSNADFTNVSAGQLTLHLWYYAPF